MNKTTKFSLSFCVFFVSVMIITALSGNTPGKPGFLGIVVVIAFVAIIRVIWNVPSSNRSIKNKEKNDIKTLSLGTYTIQDQLDVDNYDKFLNRDYSRISARMTFSHNTTVSFAFENGTELNFRVVDSPVVNGNEVKASLIAENGQQAYLYKNYNQLSLVNTTTRVKVLMKN